MSGATAHATQATDGPSSLLFALHFLRQYSHQILQAAEVISLSPHRVLIREELIRPVAQATRLDGAAIRGRSGPAKQMLDKAKLVGHTRFSQSHLPRPSCPPQYVTSSRHLSRWSFIRLNRRER